VEQAHAGGNATFGVPVLVANRDMDRSKLYGRGYYNKVLKTMGEADANARDRRPALGARRGDDVVSTSVAFPGTRRGPTHAGGRARDHRRPVPARGR